jgi:hypothetical protein
MSLNGRDVQQHGEVKSRFSHGGDTAFIQITERPLNFGELVLENKRNWSSLALYVRRFINHKVFFKSNTYLHQLH